MIFMSMMMVMVVGGGVKHMCRDIETPSSARSRTGGSVLTACIPSQPRIAAGVQPLTPYQGVTCLMLNLVTVAGEQRFPDPKFRT